MSIPGEKGSQPQHKEPEKDPKKPLKDLKFLLPVAAQLEHTLLVSYLYSTFSLKTMPEEFEFLDDGKTLNPRRAIHFELARECRKSLITICKEEMYHLHLVNALLSHLREDDRTTCVPPAFGFPRRDADGNFLFDRWRFATDWDGSAAHEDPQPTKVPLEPLSSDVAKRFLAFESPKAVQGQTKAEWKKMLSDLYKWEMQFFAAKLSFTVATFKEREDVKHLDAELYNTINNILIPTVLRTDGLGKLDTQPQDDVETFTFENIAQFYGRVSEAFKALPETNWKNEKHGLLEEDEQRRDAIALASQIQPVPRVNNDPYQDIGKPIVAAYSPNNKDLFTAVKVCTLICEEGEGFDAKSEKCGKTFPVLVQELVTKFSPPQYYVDMQINRLDDEEEDLRASHCYRFATIHQILEKQFGKSGITPFRKQLKPTSGSHLFEFAVGLVKYFNATYLGILVMLMRLYNPNLVEEFGLVAGQLATWPAMSQLIRPLLEALSFFDLKHLSQEIRKIAQGHDDASVVTLLRPARVPSSPESATATEAKPKPPQEEKPSLLLFDFSRENLPDSREVPYINQLRVSFESLHKCAHPLHNAPDLWLESTFAACGDWFGRQEPLIFGFEHPELTEAAKKILHRSMMAAKVAKEFEKQIPFRQAGGVNVAPLPKSFPLDAEANRYNEHPDNFKLDPDGYHCRIRYTGPVSVQMAYDPDPNTDSVGCNGKGQIYSTDEKTVFNRAFLFGAPANPDDLINHDLIDRTPEANKPAPHAHKPYEHKINPSADHVFPGPPQLVPFEIVVKKQYYATTEEVQIPNPEQLKVNLVPRHDGVYPVNLSYNTIIQDDSGTLDPYILQLGNTKREVLSPHGGVWDMSPEQLYQTSRFAPMVRGDTFPDYPCLIERAKKEGFAISNRAVDDQPCTYNPPLKVRGPDNVAQMESRLAALNQCIEALKAKVNEHDQKSNDRLFSLTMRRANLKRSFVNYRMMCSVKHTIGGAIQAPWTYRSDQRQLDELMMKLQPAAPKGKAFNYDESRRWLTTFYESALDSDALRFYVVGEVLVPLVVVDAPPTTKPVPAKPPCPNA